LTALSTSADVLAALTALVPTSQLLLGTDYPMAQEIGLYVSLDGINTYAAFSDADRRRIKRDNAPRLLGPSVPRQGGGAAAPALARGHRAEWKCRTPTKAPVRSSP
jgi:Amidohydrolase